MLENSNGLIWQNLDPFCQCLRYLHSNTLFSPYKRIKGASGLQFQWFMKKLSYLLTLIFLASGCGRSFENSLVPGDVPKAVKIEHYGTNSKGEELNGSAYQAERPSEARPRLEKAQANGIDLSEGTLLFDENTREIKTSILYTKRIDGKSFQTRILLTGIFSDFNKPIIMRSHIATKGDIVRAFAFCKSGPEKQADVCEYLVVDYYFVGLSGQLENIQMEKRISADLIIQDADQEVKDEEVVITTPAEEVEPVVEIAGSENSHDELEIVLPLGDIQTTKPKDPDFYKDWIVPDVVQPKVAVDVQQSKPVVVTEKKAAVQPQVKPIEDSVEAPKEKKVIKPIPRSESDLSDEEELVEISEPRAPNAINEDDVTGERISFDPNKEYIAEDQRLSDVFNLLGIVPDQDSNQAVGHYARGSLKNPMQLGESNSTLGLLRYHKNDYASFGTGLLVKTLIYFATWTQENLSENLKVNDLSKKSGGQIARHSSHQNGLDADIIYLDIEGRYGKIDVEKNWNLLRALDDTGLVSSIFVSSSRKKEFCDYAKSKGLVEETKAFTKKLYIEPNHTDHFHLRLVCSELNIGSGCRNDGVFPSARSCQ